MLEPRGGVGKLGKMKSNTKTTKVAKNAKRVKASARGNGPIATFLIVWFPKVEPGPGP